MQSTWQPLPMSRFPSLLREPVSSSGYVDEVLANQVYPASMPYIQDGLRGGDTALHQTCEAPAAMGRAPFLCSVKIFAELPQLVQDHGSTSVMGLFDRDYLVMMGYSWSLLRHSAS